MKRNGNGNKDIFKTTSCQFKYITENHRHCDINLPKWARGYENNRAQKQPFHPSIQVRISTKSLSTFSVILES